MHADSALIEEQVLGAQAPPTPPRMQPPAFHPQQASAAERALHVDIPRRSNTVSASEEDSE